MSKNDKIITTKLIKNFAFMADSSFMKIFMSFTIGKYFQLKSNIPLTLCSNAVYKFTYSCKMNLASTRHLITRAREYLNFNSIRRSAIKDHIFSCAVCSDVQCSSKSFTVIKKYQSEFHTKMHEALLIKKHPPKLNRQLFVQRSVCFFFKCFKLIIC